MFIYIWGAWLIFATIVHLLDLFVQVNQSILHFKVGLLMMWEEKSKNTLKPWAVIMEKLANPGYPFEITSRTSPPSFICPLVQATPIWTSPAWHLLDADFFVSHFRTFGFCHCFSGLCFSALQACKHFVLVQCEHGQDVCSQVGRLVTRKYTSKLFLSNPVGNMNGYSKCHIKWTSSYWV